MDVKPLLIDLEAKYDATGGKQAIPAVQPERLSEGDWDGTTLKQCLRCLEWLEESLYYYKSANKKKHNICKPCKLGRLQEHRQAMRKWVNDWKEEMGCSECGFKGHHFQLDLDHTDPSTKANKGNHRSFEPGWSKERITLEIQKCVILCANCHRMKTFLYSDHLPVCDSPAHDENNT